MIKGSWPQETVRVFLLSLKRAARYAKAKLTEMKRQRDKLIIIVGDLYNPLSAIDKRITQKIIKVIEELTHHQPIDMYSLP